MQAGVLDPQYGSLVWTIGIAVILALVGLVVRVLLRLARPAPTVLREAVELEALRMRVDVLESDLHAFDASYEQLKARTEFTERLLERKAGADARTT